MKPPSIHADTTSALLVKPVSIHLVGWWTAGRLRQARSRWIIRTEQCAEEPARWTYILAHMAHAPAVRPRLWSYVTNVATAHGFRPYVRSNIKAFAGIIWWQLTSQRSGNLDWDRRQDRPFCGSCRRTCRTRCALAGLRPRPPCPRRPCSKTLQFPALGSKPLFRSRILFLIFAFPVLYKPLARRPHGRKG